MVSIIQDCPNSIAFIGVNLPNKVGEFSLKIYTSCSTESVKDVEFFGVICNRTLLATIDHSCSDKSKIDLDIGNYIYELYEQDNKLTTNHLIIYKNGD